MPVDCIEWRGRPCETERLERVFVYAHYIVRANRRVGQSIPREPRVVPKRLGKHGPANVFATILAFCFQEKIYFYSRPKQPASPTRAYENILVILSYAHDLPVVYNSSSSSSSNAYAKCVSPTDKCRMVT